jgi:hypothetical protein
VAHRPRHRGDRARRRRRLAVALHPVGSLARIVTTHYLYKRPPEKRAERRIVLSALCGMVGLATVEPALSAENTFDGAYTGKRVTKGSGPTCPTDDDVSVTIHGAELTSTNSGFRNFALGFDPHQGGSFSQTYVDTGGSAVFVQGRIAGDVLDADVINGTCEHHWHLKRSP